MEDNKQNDITLSLNLPSEQYAYLEELSHKAKVTYGKKLSHAVLLRSMIKLLKEMSVKPSGAIKSEAQLLECLVESARKYKK